LGVFGGAADEAVLKGKLDLRLGQAWRIAAGIAGAFGFFLSVGLSGAWAHERHPEEKLRDDWLFARGRVEIGGHIGGGFSMQHQDRSASLFTVVPGISYVFAEYEGSLPGSLEIVGEPSCFAVFEGRTAHVSGLAALIKYNFRTGTKLTPFIDAGTGISYGTIPVPRGGTHFNFSLQAGVGVHYTIGTWSTLDFEWRYNHFSNAYIIDNDPGINASSFLLGFSLLNSQPRRVIGPKTSPRSLSE